MTVLRWRAEAREYRRRAAAAGISAQDRADLLAAAVDADARADAQIAEEDGPAIPAIYLTRQAPRA